LSSINVQHDTDSRLLVNVFIIDPVTWDCSTKSDT